MSPSQALFLFYITFVNNLNQLSLKFNICNLIINYYSKKHNITLTHSLYHKQITLNYDRIHQRPEETIEDTRDIC